jgi:hypothetical protein
MLTYKFRLYIRSYFSIFRKLGPKAAEFLVYSLPPFVTQNILTMTKNVICYLYRSL